MSLFRRNKRKFVVNEPDPAYNVIYLGNVVTPLAKGDNCFEKPLGLIWKSYCTRTRPDMPMRLMISRSGLKAETKQQGLTEYWSHRITFCVAPSTHPKVFVWIYKHEGKRMKPELRCHAVLCKRSHQPEAIAVVLHEKLAAALLEYRREKLSKQNIRLSGSLVTSLPRRRLMLSAAQHFRPPMARSKSAPKLHSIEEDDEGEEEDIDDEMMDEITLNQPDSSSILSRSQRCVSDWYPLPSTLLIDDVEDDSSTSASARCLATVVRCPIFEVDVEIGNDVERLKLDDRVRRAFDAEDSISDESGYHEEKSSLEEDTSQEDSDCSDQDNHVMEMTAL